MSNSNCCFLTFIQISQEAGKVHLISLKGLKECHTIIASQFYPFLITLPKVLPSMTYFHHSAMKSKGLSLLESLALLEGSQKDFLGYSFPISVCICELCDSMGNSLQDSSVHRIFQARMLEWLPFPSPGDLSDPEIKLMSPALAGRFFTTVPPGKLLSPQI